MESERLDCSWCGSARSIEYNICQVCLMEYPLDTRVLELPRDRPERKTGRIVRLDREDVAAEK